VWTSAAACTRRNVVDPIALHSFVSGEIDRNVYGRRLPFEPLPEVELRSVFLEPGENDLENSPRIRCAVRCIDRHDRSPCSLPGWRLHLLRLDDWNTWTKWFAAAGVVDPVAHGPVLNRASMLIDAAVDGQGIALARTALAAWDLINGRLVRPIDVSLKMSNTYWIVCPKATSSVPKIATFRKWLLAEAAEDARRLKELSVH
jgi:DNA-binding transcriptional LysR family regulator